MRYIQVLRLLKKLIAKLWSIMIQYISLIDIGNKKKFSQQKWINQAYLQHKSLKASMIEKLLCLWLASYWLYNCKQDLINQNQVCADSLFTRSEIILINNRNDLILCIISMAADFRLIIQWWLSPQLIPYTLYDTAVNINPFLN